METCKSPMTKAIDRLKLLIAVGPLLGLVFQMIPDDAKEKSIVAQAIIDIGTDFLKR